MGEVKVKICPFGLVVLIPIDMRKTGNISRFSHVDRDQHYQSKWANFHFYLAHLLPPIS